MKSLIKTLLFTGSFLIVIIGNEGCKKKSSKPNNSGEMCLRTHITKAI